VFFSEYHQVRFPMPEFAARIDRFRPMTNGATACYSVAAGLQPPAVGCYMPITFSDWNAEIVPEIPSPFKKDRPRLNRLLACGFPEKQDDRRSCYCQLCYFVG
jgi:hypothetical protein